MGQTDGSQQRFMPLSPTVGLGIKRDYITSWDLVCHLIKDWYIFPCWMYHVHTTVTKNFSFCALFIFICRVILLNVVFSRRFRSTDISATVRRLRHCNRLTMWSRQSQSTGAVCYEIEIYDMSVRIWNSSQSHRVTLKPTANISKRTDFEFALRCPYAVVLCTITAVIPTCWNAAIIAACCMQ